MIDVERIFTYRALRQARNDTTPLASFDQNQLVANSNANDREIKALLAEYSAVRASTLTLFNSFDQDALTRKGENSMSVRAIAYFLAGHEWHHFNSLQENYAPSANEY